MNWISLGRGAILSADGLTPCKNRCYKDCKVKDLIDRVCSQELGIVPVARIFFALCDPDTGIPLSPYHILTQEEAKRRYQLRVFVNMENGLQLLRMSKQAYQYYYAQLREDFVADKLYPRTTINTAVWMAAIHMAKEAHKDNLNYKNLIRSSKDLNRFMPKFLRDRCKKDMDVQNKLYGIFTRFKKIHDDVEDLEHYETKYVEVYEKDIMCGKHLFRLKSETRKSVIMLVVLSWKEGIYKTSVGEPTANKQVLCFVGSLCGIHVVGTTVTLSIRAADDPPDQFPEKVSMSFFDKKEAHSFSIIAHTYYHLMVDGNGLILTGGMTPDDEFLRVGGNPNDGLKMDLCHVPISSRDVTSMLSKNGMMTDGNFLIRESRNTNSAYTLSLCYQGSVINYRILCNGNGYSFQDSQNNGEGSSHQLFSTMKELIDRHSHDTGGLPTRLLINYAPCFTGPIPLLKKMASEISRQVSISPDDLSSILYNADSPISTNGQSDTPFPPSHRMGDSPPPHPLMVTNYDSTESPCIKDLVVRGVRYFYYNTLITTRELGSGNFSTVYLAEIASGEDVLKVAVKIPTMKEKKIDMVKNDLLREILTMNSLSHPNIVKLLGISETKHYLNYIGVIPVMIMEFVDRGSLRNYLNCLNPDKKNSDRLKIKHSCLLYGKQIADGMSYLESKKVIHRDLATRNVLIVSDTHVKITDFGLARICAENSNYYKAATVSNELPIYWCSPECLETFKFSTKGDVWSYGVTLWEMFTLGSSPSNYLMRVIQSDFSNSYSLLAQWYNLGNRLSGLSCDPGVYSSVIKKCWNINTVMRPSFDELSIEMDKLHRSLSERFSDYATPTVAATTFEGGGDSNSKNAQNASSSAGHSLTSNQLLDNAPRNPSPTVPTSSPVSSVTNSNEFPTVPTSPPVSSVTNNNELPSPSTISTPLTMPNGFSSLIPPVHT